MNSKLIIIMMFLLGTSPCYATMTDTQLYKAARIALDRGDYSDVAMYLKAYVERDPLLMQIDATHKTNVEKVLKSARIEARDMQNLAKDVPKLKRDLQQCKTGISSTVSGLSLPLMKLVPITDSKGPKTYPLVCRGGGDLSMSWGAYDHVPGKKNMLVTRFERGSQGYSDYREALKPGQCSWLDRGVRPTEPDQICHQLHDFALFWKPGSQKKPNVSSSAPSYVYKMGDPNYIAQFDAFNDRAGCFIVTVRKKDQSYIKKFKFNPKNLRIRQFP